MSRRGEGGTAVVGTTFGFAAFLGFLLLAVQVSVALYARSTATATTFDQARRLAQRGPACTAHAEEVAASTAEHLRRWWVDVRVVAECDGTAASVRVDGSRTRSLVPAPLLRPARLAELHHRATVRLEVPR